MFKIINGKGTGSNTQKSAVNTSPQVKITSPVTRRRSLSWLRRVQTSLTPRTKKALDWLEANSVRLPK